MRRVDDNLRKSVFKNESNLLHSHIFSPTQQTGWYKKNNTSSSSSLSDDRLKASSKTIPPHIAIQSFLLQMRVSSLSLRSSSSFLRLLPCLLVTSISPFIFPSITCFRRQFLRKMWPIQLAFRFLIACRVFLCSLTWSNTSSFLT